MTLPAPAIQPTETVAEYAARLERERQIIPQLEGQIAAMTARLEYARQCDAQLTRLELTVRAVPPAAPTARKTDGPTAPAILTATLRQRPGLTPAELTTATGLKGKTVSAALSIMLKSGQVIREEGRYSLPQPQEGPSEPQPAPEPAEPRPLAPESLESRTLKLLADARRPVSENALAAKLPDTTLPALRGLLVRMRNKGSVMDVEPGKWTLKGAA